MEVVQLISVNLHLDGSLIALFHSHHHPVGFTAFEASHVSAGDVWGCVLAELDESARTQSLTAEPERDYVRALHRSPSPSNQGSTVNGTCDARGEEDDGRQTRSLGELLCNTLMPHELLWIRWVASG